MYSINKKDMVEKFREFLNRNGVDDSASKDTEVTRSCSKLDVIGKILDVYKFVLNQSKILIRREYIHDDAKYAEVVGKIESCINNKIRSASDGRIYIKVGNLVTFDGSREQFAEWMFNKNKQLQIMRHVIDELNNYLSGEPLEDDNKPLCFDMKTEDVITFLVNSIPESFYDDPTEKNLELFKQKFEDTMVKLRVERKYWESFNFDRFLIKTTNIENEDA